MDNTLFSIPTDRRGQDLAPHVSFPIGFSRSKDCRKCQLATASPAKPGELPGY
jgi:hypothetical protein